MDMALQAIFRSVGAAVLLALVALLASRLGRHVPPGRVRDFLYKKRG